MYPQLVIALYGQYLAAMYAASLFNPANYFPDLHLVPAHPRALPDDPAPQGFKKPDRARPCALQETRQTIACGRAKPGCTKAGQPVRAPSIYCSEPETHR
jgi:hypothetical protein